MKQKKLTYRHKSGYSVPQNYFDELEEGILHAVTSNEESEVVGLPSRPGFSISENYFATVEEKILQKTLYTQKTGPKVVKLYHRKSFYAAAASIAAIFVLFLSIFNFEKTIPLTLNDVELSSLENYIEEGYIDFSASDISSFFEDGNYNSQMDVSDIENEDLIDYFEQYTDPTLLIE